MEDLNCCYIEPYQNVPCIHNAEWEIWPIYWENGDNHIPEDEYILACSDHLAHLLTDAEEHRILNLDKVIGNHE